MNTPLSLPTLPTVIVFYILSFLQPNRYSWMTVYARVCLVSKSWGSIAAERVATVEYLFIMCWTGADFAALAVLLRHCGAPVLRILELTYCYPNKHDHYSAVHLEIILEQLAVGRAPRVGVLTLKGPCCIQKWNL